MTTGHAPNTHPRGHGWLISCPALSLPCSLLSSETKTRQAEAYEKDAADFRSKDCEVLGISTNPIEKIKEFKAQYGLRYPSLTPQSCSPLQECDPGHCQLKSVMI